MHKIFKIEVVFDDEDDLRAFLDNPDGINPKDIPTMRVQDRRKHKGWTQFEDGFIVDNYQKHPAKYIAKSLGRTKSGVAQRVSKLRAEGRITKMKIQRANRAVTINKPL